MDKSSLSFVFECGCASGAGRASLPMPGETKAWETTSWPRFKAKNIHKNNTAMNSTAHGSVCCQSCHSFGVHALNSAMRTPCQVALFASTAPGSEVLTLKGKSQGSKWQTRCFECTPWQLIDMWEVKKSDPRVRERE